jgi:ubiquitin-protein ligase
MAGVGVCAYYCYGRRRTKFKEVRVAVQFPKDYPGVPLIVELKSKTLSGKVLDSLTRLCDEELKKWKGKQQTLSLLLFIKRFLDENPFIACSDEVVYIKKELIGEQDDLKLKQKSGIVYMTIRQNKLV